MLRRPRHPRRQRPPDHSPSGGPASPRTTCRARCGCCGGPRRPVRLPPRGVGRHAAPLVRLLALGRRQRHHGASRASTSRRAGQWADTTPTGRSRARDIDVFLQGTTATNAGTLGLSSGGAPTRCTFTDGPTSSPRTPRSSTPTGSQTEPPRVPVAAADARPAHLGHADVDLQASLEHDAEQPRRAARRLRRGVARHRATRGHLDRRDVDVLGRPGSRSTSTPATATSPSR